MTEVKPALQPERVFYLSEESVLLLHQWGMPLTVARYVQSTPGFRSWKKGVTGMATLVIMVGLMWALIFGWLALRPTELIRRIGLVPEDSFLITGEFVSMLGPVFLAIGLTGVITNLIAYSSSDLAVQTALTNLHMYAAGPDKRLVPWYIKRLLKRIPPTLSPQEYLRAYCLADAWFAARFVVVLLCLMSVVFVWDGLTASCATPDGVLYGSHFRLTRTLVPWEDVREFSTGCYYTKNGTVRNFSYEVELPNELFVDFGDAGRIKSGSPYLDNLLTLERYLRQNNVPWTMGRFRAGVNSGKTKWTKECAERMREELEDGDARKLTLLLARRK